jgi:hypothetical protein
VNSDRFVGRPLDSLSLKERWRLAGHWIALEVYTPSSVPLRVIEALGTSPTDCAKQLAQRGLDPTRFEFCPLSQPYRQ